MFTGNHDSTAVAHTEVNLLVLHKVNVNKLLHKNAKEMKSFVQIAMKRKEYHQDMIIRSLRKDRDAFKTLKKTQRADEIDPNSPVQFMVKNLRKHLEAKVDKSDFDEKVYRLIRKSPVGESDSEDGGIELDENFYIEEPE